MMKCCGCVTDFNGTLFKDTPIHLQVWGELYQEITKDPGYPDPTKFLGKNNLETLKIMKPGMSEEWYTEMSQEKERRYRAKALKIPGGPKLTEGAEEMLNWLKDHQIPLNMATASIQENVDFYVETFQLERWFQRNQIVYDDGQFNDKESMYREAVKRIGISTNALILEDSPAGIEGASKLEGSCVFAIQPAGTTLSNPSVIQCAPDFTNILPILETLFR